MKALITGASGFVGPYLAKAVRENLKYEVVGTIQNHNTDSFSEGEVRELDIMDPAAVLALLQDEHPQCIFHLAAQSSVSRSWKDPAGTVSVNVKGTLNLLDALRQLEYRPKVILAGSGEEYGYVRPEEVPVKEEQFLRPGNIYAATKAGQNMMATVYAQAYNLQLIMTRSFNHMGPGQSPVFVVADFCRQAVRVEKGLQSPEIHVGNLSAMRDFTDVRDVVNAYTALAQFGLPGETYNVGTGKAVKIADILDLIIKISGADIKPVVDKEKLRPVDVPIIEPDVSKIYKATGWRPQIKLEQTIADTLDYFRENEELLK
ncbi:MAG: GDP-mannose 4,6-dehydratase [Lachnospiraceae bacterium]|nr:GDP-mannose 4,6-dehydratase [Lachnospiraceae bacterium]